VGKAGLNDTDGRIVCIEKQNIKAKLSEHIDGIECYVDKLTLASKSAAGSAVPHKEDIEK